MAYQNFTNAAQATDEIDAGAAERLAAANINPATGLATDYLNHFNEAIMLLELLPSSPECRDDFLAWRPMSYREHFFDSHLSHRALAVEAYERADRGARESLDALAGTMISVLADARASLAAEMPPSAAAALAERAAASLKPLIARAGAVINGHADAADMPEPQAVADDLMKS